MKLVKAMATVGGFTLLSRVVGMVRDMLTAAILGVGPIADAFIVALRLPNFFRSVTAEGAFSVSFVPLYAKTLETEGEEDAAKFAGQALTVMSVLIAIFSALMMIGMPWVLRVIAPGCSSCPPRSQACDRPPVFCTGALRRHRSALLPAPEARQRFFCPGHKRARGRGG